jgi:hypothetical protein
MKHIQMYENFQEGKMKKPLGFFSKLAKDTKHAMGYENDEDRKSLHSIHKSIINSNIYDYVTNVREIKPGVIVASVMDTSVTVDKNTPEIMYRGKVLDLYNIEEEANLLYNALLNI